MSSLLACTRVRSAHVNLCSDNEQLQWADVSFTAPVTVENESADISIRALKMGTFAQVLRRVVYIYFGESITRFHVCSHTLALPVTSNW
jgi:hypothetical protein